MILYIGNKLSKYGLNPTSVETVGKLLSDNYTILTVSDKKYKIVRLIHMISSIIINKKNISVCFIDTYSTMNFWYAYLCSLVCINNNIPYVLIIRGGDFPNRYAESKKKVDYIFNKAKKIISPSNYIIESLQPHKNKIQVIPNTIPIENYFYKERKLFKAKLLWVRTFADLYNPKLAIDVVNKLKEDYPNVMLTMIGGDRDGIMNEIKEYAKTKNVIENVIFTGRLSKKEWHKVSENSDIFINTTNIDNTPVSVIEAMALGLAVVSTNVGGIPYLLEDKVDSLLVDKNNATQMSDAIKKIINNPHTAESITKNARMKVEAFDWEVVRHQWDELIGDLE